MSEMFYVTTAAGGVTGVGYTPDGTLPPGAVVCTQEESLAAGQWSTIVDGALVIGTPPGPTAEQQSQAELATRIAAGITITSTNLPAVNGTYALDSVSTAQIFQIGLYADRFGVFPSGGPTQMYPDIAGAPHSFTVAMFVAFLRAVAQLDSALQTQAGVMANGGTPAWPSQTVAIA